MTKTVDAAAFQKMVIHAAAAINAQKQSINDLNVFPVPDLSLIHISEPTRLLVVSRMPSSA